jgi:poly-gamma-glutamate capsule biosynthesis protein CapA/YwtB (metallophosphatase superfamily)
MRNVIPHRVQQPLLCVALTLLIASTILLAGGRTTRHVRGRSGLDQCDSLLPLIIQPEGNTVRLRWMGLSGVDQWVVLRATRADMSDQITVATLPDTNTWLESSSIFSSLSRAFYRVLARWNQGSPENCLIIENFEHLLELQSYSPAEDVEPDGWQMWFDGRNIPSTCFEIYGNSWKREPIEPAPLGAGSVWRISAKCLKVGATQGFGIADSANEMWYGLWGRDVRQSEAWNNIYQGYYSDTLWHVMDLQVGDDWFGRFGYYPRITSLLYANDMDSPYYPGDIRFDDILDVTGAITLPPVARFTWQIAGHPRPDTMEVAFCSMGCDPDGPLLQQRWVFGDGTYSNVPRPVHRYAAGHVYHVSLFVQDTAGRSDWIVHEVADTHATATQQITALFGGDVMMARRYESDGGVPGIIPTYGVNYIFSRIRPLVSSVELAMCNLECPLTTYTQHHPTKQYTFKGRPEYVAGLSYAGFDFCALANNHDFDYLAPGMVQTEFVLDSVGILRAGAGDDDELAGQPALFSMNGLCVAILSFCNRDGTADNEQPYLAAGPSRAGFAMWDRAHIETLIPRAHRLADVVVVQVHSGVEYATIPPDVQMARAVSDEEYVGTFNLLPDTSDVALRHYAIDMGADLLVNHHPHVLEGIEVYHNKLIAHSMGNFAFDQQFFETFPSMAVTTTLSPSAAGSFIVHPVFIDRYVPTPATGELGGAILDYISELSRDLGTWIVRGANADTAVVIIDTLVASRSGSTYADALTLETHGSWAESAPFLMRGTGYPVWASVSAPTGSQIRIGREQLWFGNMEAEGATQWNLNSSYERYDTTTYYRGRRSIGQNRSASSTGVTTNLLWRLPLVTNAEYSIAGWISGSNAVGANIAIALYNSRTGGSNVANVTAGSEQNGTFNWRFVWSDFLPPANGYYGDVSVNIHAPSLSEERCWFDDVMLVKWEPWRTGTVNVPFPGDIRYVQVRAPLGNTTAQISYRREWVNGVLASAN